jgi:predicted amidophosphoribosyltransferase
MLDTGTRIPFCQSCVVVLTHGLPEPLCAQCGRPIVSTAVADGISLPCCRLCRLGTYDFDVARSFGPYTLPMSRAILMLKYGEVTPLGKWFARQLVKVVESNPGAFAADVLG